MSRALGIIKKLDKVLSRMNVTDRTVSARITTVGGGDPLTGRGSVASKSSYVLEPQPAVVVANKAYPLVIAGQALSPDAEYLATISVNALSKADLTNPNLTIVFTDDSGNEEILYVIGFQPNYINGTDIAFSCVLSSKKR